MSKDLEQMLRDIYELDPTLEERDGEVRTIIVALISSRPEVAASADFARRLRAELLMEKPQLETKVHLVHSLLSPYSPYLRYFAPLGAVAILLFMLLPAPLSYQAVSPMEVLPTDVAPPITPTDMSPEINVVNKARMFMAPDNNTADAPSAPEARTMKIEMDTMAFPEVPSDFVNIESPQAGASVLFVNGYVSAPTLLVVRESSQPANRIIGASPLVEGALNSLPLPLAASLLPGKTYTMKAFLDTNQDGTFTPDIDQPVIDIEGQEIQTWFTVR